jgi:hypothetical protein
VPAPTTAEQDSVRKIVSVLYLSGAITVVLGIALGFVISPSSSPRSRSESWTS